MRVARSLALVERHSLPHVPCPPPLVAQVLRKIACRESDQLGDVSTLADPSIVPLLVEKVEALYGAKK